jgi:hypothetical protein
LHADTLTARRPRPDHFVNCPHSSWEGTSPTSCEDPRAAFGARLMAEYQADFSGPIVSSLFFFVVFFLK